MTSLLRPKPLANCEPNLGEGHFYQKVSQYVYHVPGVVSISSPLRTPVHVCAVTLVVSDSAVLWIAACQAPLSMVFSSLEYWSGLPCLPPGGLPNPGIEPTSLMTPALAGRFFTLVLTWEAQVLCTLVYILKRILLQQNNSLL